jgi:hypothetical protein
MAAVRLMAGELSIGFYRSNRADKKTRGTLLFEKQDLRAIGSEVFWL